MGLCLQIAYHVIFLYICNLIFLAKTIVLKKDIGKIINLNFINVKYAVDKTVKLVIAHKGV